MNSDRQFLFLLITAIVAVLTSSVAAIFSSIQVAIATFVIVIFLAIFYRYPRTGLWLFLVYIPFSGSFIYAVTSIYSAVGGYVKFSVSDYAAFQFIKDAFYFPALVAFVFSGKFWQPLKAKLSHPIVLAILSLLVVTLLTFFLVNFPQQLATKGREKPIIMGLIGLKILIGYIPLLFCAKYLIRHREDLKFLLRLQVILAAICCLLALVQYILLTQGICPGNINLPEPAYSRVSLQARCFVGGSLLYNPNLNLISLPGTFAAPWQWSWFLISSIFLTYATAIKENRLWNIISWITVGLICVSAFICGQTTAAILVPSILFILLLVTEKNRQILAIKLGIFVFLVIVLGKYFGVIDGIINRWNYAPPEEFIVEQFNWIFRKKLSLFGQGLGRASSAARRFGKIVAVETFYPKLLYEIGAMGTIVFLGTVSLLTVHCFKVYRSLKDISLRHLGLCLWIFVFLLSYNTFQTPLAVDPVAVYYWFFAGVLWQLPKLEREEIGK